MNWYEKMKEKLTKEDLTLKVLISLLKSPFAPASDNDNLKVHSLQRLLQLKAKYGLN